MPSDIETVTGLKQRTGVKNVQQKSNRRDFLKNSVSTVSSAVALPYVITSTALGNKGVPAASERVTVGHIGVGGQGGGLLRGFLNVDACQSVAVCDCFATRRTGPGESLHQGPLHQCRVVARVRQCHRLYCRLGCPSPGRDALGLSSYPCGIRGHRDHPHQGIVQHRYALECTGPFRLGRGIYLWFC